MLDILLVLLLDMVISPLLLVLLLAVFLYIRIRMLLLDQGKQQMLSRLLNLLLDQLLLK
uniref:Uncharacterized protein n=1 Tax=Picea glauca TaxID=3330 RepID=A0A101LZA3_PICGL|nr:hypothetical protein ABT39_MTgene4963 [Picea glauca]QHR90396.1 hypothetical protein Q903MT_gene4419 [Picea sitchensis]